MENHMDIPNFASEAEEADWWPQQEDALFDAFQKAEATGALDNVTAADTNGLLLIAGEDAALASGQAARKGVTIQAHLQSLLHKALLEEEQRRAS